MQEQFDLRAGSVYRRRAGSSSELPVLRCRFGGTPPVFLSPLKFPHRALRPLFIIHRRSRHEYRYR
jgi:hypothetical protein